VAGKEANDRHPGPSCFQTPFKEEDEIEVDNPLGFSAPLSFSD
jgi:hypothetical protein